MAWIDIYWPDKDKPRRRDIEDGLVLGRSQDCEETLDDESVSGKHAWIRPVKDKFLLVDLKSTNGVKVDGKRVTDFVLHNGQHFMLADIPCVFHNPAEPPPKEKKDPKAETPKAQPSVKPTDLPKEEPKKDVVPEGGLPGHPALVYQCSECGYLMAEKGDYCTRCGDRIQVDTGFIVEEPEAPRHPPATVRVLSCLSLAAGMLGPLFLGIGWLLGIVFGMLVLVGYAEEAEETDMQRARYGILFSVLWITVAIWVGRYLYLRAGL